MFLKSKLPSAVEVRSKLFKNSVLEESYSEIKDLFSNNLLYFLDYSFFRLSQQFDNLDNSETLVLILFFLRASFEMNSVGHVRAIWGTISKSSNHSVLCIFDKFCSDDNFLEIFNLTKNEFLRMINDSKLSLSLKNISDLIFEMRESTIEVSTIPFILDKRRNISDYEFDAMMKELSQIEDFDSEIELPIPFPDSLSIKENDFLTPFPFLYENPILNPILPYQDIIDRFIQNYQNYSEAECNVK